MYVPLYIYYILLALAIISFIGSYLIKRKFKGVKWLLLNLFRILCVRFLFSLWYSPRMYEIYTCDKVNKNILLFPINTFGDDAAMGCNHCYVFNPNNQNLQISFYNSINDSIPYDTMMLSPRTGEKVEVTRINYFFKTIEDIRATENVEGKFTILNCLNN